MQLGPSKKILRLCWPFLQPLSVLSHPESEVHTCQRNYFLQANWLQLEWMVLRHQVQLVLQVQLEHQVSEKQVRSWNFHPQRHLWNPCTIKKCGRQPWQNQFTETQKVFAPKIHVPAWLHGLTWQSFLRLLAMWEIWNMPDRASIIFFHLSKHSWLPPCGTCGDGRSECLTHSCPDTFLT